MKVISFLSSCLGSGGSSGFAGLPAGGVMVMTIGGGVMVIGAGEGDSGGEAVSGAGLGGGGGAGSAGAGAGEGPQAAPQSRSRLSRIDSVDFTGIGDA